MMMSRHGTICTLLSSWNLLCTLILAAEFVPCFTHDFTGQAGALQPVTVLHFSNHCSLLGWLGNLRGEQIKVEFGKWKYMENILYRLRAEAHSHLCLH